jgi:outer membrane biosynthesis protein TonB
LANDIEGDVMQLALPATSIFGKEEGENRPLQAYARWLVAQSVDPSMVVTRMKFDTKAEAPKIHFKAMRWLTDDEFTEAGTQGKTDDALKAVTMSVGATDGAKPADAMQGDKPKAKAAPAPEADEEDEAPAPAPKAAKKAKAAPAPVAEDNDESEPEVRKAEKKPSAVPGKKSLADVVGGWDDED